MAAQSVAEFVAKFTEMWKSPEPGAFSALFHPEGRLLHPTMDGSISRDQVPAYVAAIKERMPDISLEVLNWAARGDVVLIEWTITGTYGEAEISWSGADRFTLRDGLAVEGIAYFDTMPLWSRLDPSARRGDLVEVPVPAPPGQG